MWSLLHCQKMKIWRENGLLISKGKLSKRSEDMSRKYVLYTLNYLASKEIYRWVKIWKGNFWLRLKQSLNHAIILIYFLYLNFRYSLEQTSTETIATFVKRWRYRDLTFPQLGKTTTKKKNKCRSKKQELRASFVKIPYHLQWNYRTIWNNTDTNRKCYDHQCQHSNRTQDD